MTRDIVIVGGGPAGVTTALALVALAPELRDRLVILEKGVYPREKYCAGGLGGRGIKVLQSLGAMPSVPHVPIDGVSFKGFFGEQTCRMPSIGRVVRRIEFDHALAEMAMSRGIVFEQGVKVLGIDDDADGARIRTSAGDREASVIVGADGVGSVVRQSMGLAPSELRAQVLELDTEIVDGDCERGLVHFDASDSRIRGYTWDFPTLVNGEPLVCRGIYALKEPGREADITGILGERLRGMGLDIAQYKNKRFAERGFSPHEALAVGKRMLVGESAGIDPVTGEGIAQAIEYGAIAARFLATAIVGKRRADVSTWPREFLHSRLATDLRARRKIVPLFYGESRPSIERFLLREPDALHLGCQHFGGIGYDPQRLLAMAGKSSLFVATRLAARAQRGL